MRELKVYGGRFFRGGKNYRAVVATRTKKRAIELLKVSANEFRDYWCETHNAIELEICMANPETIYYIDRYKPNQTYEKLSESI